MRFLLSARCWSAHGRQTKRSLPAATPLGCCAWHSIWRTKHVPGRLLPPMVKASRRVPGDTNSTEREELLTIAGKHLAWLTKDEGVLSDEHPNHTVEAKALPLEPDDTKARRSLAFDANYQISMMALGMTRLMGIDRNDETTMYLGMLARIQQLSEIVFFAARLHGDDDDVWGDCAEMKSLLAVFEGRMQ